MYLFCVQTLGHCPWPFSKSGFHSITLSIPTFFRTKKEIASLLSSTKNVKKIYDSFEYTDYFRLGTIKLNSDDVFLISGERCSHSVFLDCDICPNTIISRFTAPNFDPKDSFKDFLNVISSKYIPSLK